MVRGDEGHERSSRAHPGLLRPGHRRGPTRNFRGCQYANAATEFPDTDLPPITAHRAWLLDTLGDNLGTLGDPEPDTTARQIQVVYDGALSGSKMARSTAPIETGKQLVEALLDRTIG